MKFKKYEHISGDVGGFRQRKKLKLNHKYKHIKQIWKQKASIASGNSNNIKSKTQQHTYLPIPIIRHLNLQREKQWQTEQSQTY